MLSTLFIALREGLEASLIIGILISALHKSDRGVDVRFVKRGASAAILSSLIFAGFLNYTATNLNMRAEEIFVGLTSIIAVSLVTWMVFWMKATARTLRHQLSQKLNLALNPFALTAVAFFAVIREGIETALFVFSTTSSIKSTLAPTLGLLIGFGLAIGLGVAIYRQSFRINLPNFFKITSIALVIIAAGVLANGVGDLAAALGGANALAFDISAVIGETSILGHLLAGFLGITPSMSWLQLATWLGYGSLTLVLLLRTTNSRLVVEVTR